MTNAVTRTTNPKSKIVSRFENERTAPVCTPPERTSADMAIDD